MAGLFEDDANVRPQPKAKKTPVEKKKASKSKGSMASRMLQRVEGKADLVGAASGSNVVDFAQVDISPMRKKKVTKKDDSKIVPVINYIEDIEDDDV